jgi:hypothetical protein
MFIILNASDKNLPTLIQVVNILIGVQENMPQFPISPELIDEGGVNLLGDLSSIDLQKEDIGCVLKLIHITAMVKKKYAENYREIAIKLIGKFELTDREIEFLKLPRFHYVGWGNVRVQEEIVQSCIDRWEFFKSEKNKENIINLLVDMSVCVRESRTHAYNYKLTHLKELISDSVNNLSYMNIQELNNILLPINGYIEKEYSISE